MKNKHRILLACVFLYTSAAAFFFVRENFFTFPVNSRCHLDGVELAYRTVKSGGASLFDVYPRLNVFGIGSYYPALPHTLSLGLLLVKPDFLTLLLPNVLCLFFAALAVQRISAFFLGEVLT